MGGMIAVVTRVDAPGGWRSPREGAPTSSRGGAAGARTPLVSGLGAFGARCPSLRAVASSSGANVAVRSTGKASGMRWHLKMRRRAGKEPRHACAWRHPDERGALALLRPRALARQRGCSAQHRGGGRRPAGAARGVGQPQARAPARHFPRVREAQGACFLGHRGALTSAPALGERASGAPRAECPRAHGWLALGSYAFGLPAIDL